MAPDTLNIESRLFNACRLLSGYPACTFTGNYPYLYSLKGPDVGRLLADYPRTRSIGIFNGDDSPLNKGFPTPAEHRQNYALGEYVIWIIPTGRSRLNIEPVKLSIFAQFNFPIGCNRDDTQICAAMCKFAYPRRNIALVTEKRYHPISLYCTESLVIMFDCR